MLAKPPPFAALLCAALATGCVAAEEREAVEFDFLHATIIAPSCATSNCHSAMTAQKNLDLSDAAATCDTLVEGGWVEDGVLISILHGDATFFPAMPPDGPLPQGQIALISRWIEEGASCE